MDDYSTPVMYTDDSANVFGPMFAAFMGIYFIVILAVVLVLAVSWWKIFVKAGKPGWAAIIPIYNAYMMLLIIGRPTWWLLLFLLAFIPFVGNIAILAISIIISLDLAKSFGKTTAFGILGLWLFGIVGYPMLAFGSAKYVGPAALRPEPAKPATPAAPKT